MSNKLKVGDDWLMAGVIHALQSSTDTVTTSEIKTHTGADSTKKITYRLRKLENEGLVKLGQLSHDEHDKPGIPPMTAELTLEGREFADSVDTSRWQEPDTMARRVERLEQVVQQQQETIDTLKLMTGVDNESPLPDVLDVRGGYPAIRDAFQTQDVDVNDHVSKWVSDSVREIEDEVE